MSCLGSKPEICPKCIIRESYGENILNVAEGAKDFAVCKGLLKRLPEGTFVPIQFCLLPSPFPEKWYNLIKKIQPVMNYVLHQVANSPDFLRNCLQSTIEVDDFTANIWNLYETVEKQGVLQPLSLGLLRCDYMLNETDQEITSIKQVENNTFATAFSNIAPLAGEIHRYVLDQFRKRDEIAKLPKNGVSLSFAKAVVSAWEHYGREHAVILFIVESKELSNICDQRSLEFTMWHINSNVRVLRHTFSELRTRIWVKDGNLFVGKQEVAVVYYRWGYKPHHYENEDWELRLMIEGSRAIKCPTAGYHLAGMKRVQYELTLPGVLEKFLPNGAKADEIRQVFAKQYSLDLGEEGDSAVSLAIANPQKYVLKQEREGGGNNLYDEEVKKFLKSFGKTKKRQAYILMEKLTPSHTANYIVPSSSSPKFVNVTLEVGIYGTIIGTKDDVYQNEESGFVVKTKEVGLLEGGLCLGIGALGSLLLT